ncbi:MAG: flagellar biosynthetic protein FliO [Gammaproteobacteria bacterium]|nr:flagellar biosynthetic protein FliO [Gammaproteobacteria bacterium]
MSTKTSKPELRIPPAVTVAKPDINRSLIQLTSGLVAVLLLIGAAAWFARRFGNFHSTAGGDLRVVAGLALGARERLLVVQVADEQLLLGVAPGRVSKLHVLAKPITPKQGSGTGAGDFLEKFKAALTQRSAQGPGQDT